MDGYDRPRGDASSAGTRSQNRNVELVIEPQVVRTYNDDQALAHLGRLANVLESAASKNDWPAYVNADIEFHVSLVGLAGSTCLTEFHAIIMRRLRLQLLSVDLDGFDEGPERLHVKEHRNIVERLQAGDRQGAARVLTRHLEAALVALI